MFPADVWENVLEVPLLVLPAILRTVRGWEARRNGSLLVAVYEDAGTS